MTEDEIAEAFEIRAQVITDAPFVFENAPEDAVVPRYDYAIAFNRPDRITLSGTHRLRGICTITAVVGKGVYTAEARRLAQLVVARFPTDLVFSGVEIYERPGMKGGFNDGEEYRVPVSIYFEAPGS